MTIDPRNFETIVHDPNFSVDVMDEAHANSLTVFKTPKTVAVHELDKENAGGLATLTQGSNKGTNEDQIIALLRRDQDLQALASRDAIERNRLREKQLDLLKDLAQRKS